MKKVLLVLLTFLLIVFPAVGEEKRPPAPVLLLSALNVMPGFGLGSFIQGDNTGGLIQLAVEGVGGLCLFLVAARWMDDCWAWWTSEPAPSYLVGSDVLEATGGVLVFGSVIWGIARPIWYSVSSRRRLQRDRLRLEMMPLVDPRIGGHGLDFGMRLSITCDTG
jgi:hypothetical protein